MPTSQWCETQFICLLLMCRDTLDECRPLLLATVIRIGGPYFEKACRVCAGLWNITCVIVGGGMLLWKLFCCPNAFFPPPSPAKSCLQKTPVCTRPACCCAKWLCALHSCVGLCAWSGLSNVECGAFHRAVIKFCRAHSWVQFWVPPQALSQRFVSWLFALPCQLLPLHSQAKTCLVLLGRASCAVGLVLGILFFVVSFLPVWPCSPA